MACSQRKRQWAISLERTAFLKVFTRMPTTPIWITGWVLSLCCHDISAWIMKNWDALKKPQALYGLGRKKPIQSFNPCQFCPTTACLRPASAKSSQRRLHIAPALLPVSPASLWKNILKLRSRHSHFWSKTSLLVTCSLFKNLIVRLTQTGIFFPLLLLMDNSVTVVKKSYVIWVSKWR